MTDDVQFWDGIARRYAARPVPDQAAYATTLDRIRAHLQPGDQVLELGCGTGSTALRLAPAVARYAASDLSPRMIEIGQEKARKDEVSNVSFLVSDIRDPQRAGASYDAVLALNLLHLLDDPAAALARIHAMLRPGGLFMSKTTCRPDAGWSLKYRLMMAALPVMQWLGKAPAVTFHSVPELEAMIRGAGFDLVETGDYPAMPPAHFVVARKPAP
ncbi:MAG: class I SAM-dependent methyltransferase [Marinibacterium sp.]|nr:class I SAM-dependent methyltransferase [Marinibacterium sp.]